MKEVKTGTSQISYITKPSALIIDPKWGMERVDGVGFALEKLMLPGASVREIAYVDDMFVSALPFIEAGAHLLLAPSNAEESVKKVVSENGGFVSGKRSAEAVAEFLTEIYPNLYQNKHSIIHSIYFDMDGVLWERERFDEIRHFLSVISDCIRNCQGPYTAHPPISIATGAYKESLLRALNYILLNKRNIPAQFHRNKPPFAWPPIIFEEGYLVYDPINEKVIDLTEDEYGLVSPLYHETMILVRRLEMEINARLPLINKELGSECKSPVKEREGYNLDLPLLTRLNPDEVKRAHTLIYHLVKDLLEGIEIEFGGLYSKEELEGGEK